MHGVLNARKQREGLHLLSSEKQKFGLFEGTVHISHVAPSRVPALHMTAVQPSLDALEEKMGREAVNESRDAVQDEVECGGWLGSEHVFNEGLVCQLCGMILNKNEADSEEGQTGKEKEQLSLLRTQITRQLSMCATQVRCGCSVRRCFVSACSLFVCGCVLCPGHRSQRRFAGAAPGTAR